MAHDAAMTAEAAPVVRAGFERACGDFTTRVRELGFERTRKTFWTRRHALTVDFIHFHRSGSTYGTALNFSVDIRVHFGIRVLNDAFAAAALNGPSSADMLHAGRYHLRFNARTGSTYERCCDDLLRVVVEQGEPWFQRYRDADALLNDAGSPLTPSARDFLASACAGVRDAGNEAVSMKLLGIRS